MDSEQEYAQEIYDRAFHDAKKLIRIQLRDHLLIIGKELYENGESLSELSPKEGALRKRAGMLFDEAAQAIYLDAYEEIVSQNIEDMHEDLRRLQRLVEEGILNDSE